MYPHQSDNTFVTVGFYGLKIILKGWATLCFTVLNSLTSPGELMPHMLKPHGCGLHHAARMVTNNFPISLKRVSDTETPVIKTWGLAQPPATGSDYSLSQRLKTALPKQILYQERLSLAVYIVNCHCLGAG